MDKGAWWATVRGVARVGHDLVTELPPPPIASADVLPFPDSPHPGQTRTCSPLSSLLGKAEPFIQSLCERKTTRSWLQGLCKAAFILVILRLLIFVTSYLFPGNKRFGKKTDCGLALGWVGRGSWPRGSLCSWLRKQETCQAAVAETASSRQGTQATSWAQ